MVSKEAEAVSSPLQQTSGGSKVRGAGGGRLVPWGRVDPCCPRTPFLLICLKPLGLSANVSPGWDGTGHFRLGWDETLQNLARGHPLALAPGLDLGETPGTLLPTLICTLHSNQPRPPPCPSPLCPGICWAPFGEGMLSLCPSVLQGPAPAGPLLTAQ